MSDTLIPCHAVGECPCPTAHQRLEAVHVGWHRALDEYQDPALFAIDLNNCIQALRNVTFALQKEMAHTEGFAEWYGPWREAMKKSALLRWTVEARNTIVKEGDLAAESTTEASVVFDYPGLASLIHRRTLESRFDPSAVVGIEASSLATLEEIKVRAESRVEAALMEDAILVVERRWVADSLPNGELLDAVATAYSYLASVVKDADIQFSRARYDAELDPTTIGEQGNPYPHQMRPPCMRATHEVRTLYFRLKDGDPDVGGLARPVRPASPSEAIEKYGQPVFTLGAQTALDLVPSFARGAASILRTGEDHGWFGFYFQGARMVHTEVMAVRDRADKWRMAAHIAALAAQLNADGFINIGEVWTGVAPTDGGPYVPPALQPDRQEAVIIEAAIITGETRTALVPFSRSAFGIVQVEEVVDEVGQATSNFLAPLLHYWRAIGGGRSAGSSA